jgi:uncharacterized protein with PIN domain
MNIVDSSGWLAYFADEPNAKYFLTPLQDSALLVVPTVTIYEVFKVILRESSENEALQAVLAMQKGTVVDMNAPLAIATSLPYLPKFAAGTSTREGIFCLSAFSLTGWALSSASAAAFLSRKETGS